MASINLDKHQKEHTLLQLQQPVQTAANISAGLGAQNLLRKRGKRVGVIGDSYSANALTYNATTGQVEWNLWGYLTHMRRYLGSRVDLPRSRVYAVGGTKVDHAVSTQLPLALADGLDICIVFTGRNDVVGGTSTSGIIAGLKKVYDSLLANNVHVFAIKIRHMATEASPTDAHKLQVENVNTWIAKYAKTANNITVFDPNPLYLDYSSGLVKAGMLQNDGSHDALPGAYIMGKAVANEMDVFLPPYIYDEFVHLIDVYNVTTNPSGNLIANGLLAGSGGNSSGLGATGTIPTSWFGWRVNAGSTVSMGFSKEAFRTGLDRTVITIGGTGNGGIHQLLNYSDVGSVLEGETVEAWINNIEYDFTGGNIWGLGLALIFANAASTAITYSYDGLNSSVMGVFPDGESGVIQLRAEPAVAPAGCSRVGVRIFFVPATALAVSGTIKIGPVSCRKVI